MDLWRIRIGVFLRCGIFCILCFEALCDVSDISFNFLEAPPQFYNHNSATFVFEALVNSSRRNCSNCIFSCKLDDAISSDCGSKSVSFVGLHDGYHSLKVCANASQGVGCASYSWTIDTVHPTAYISTSTSFTNALNVTVYISFSEPCAGGGGFGCSSVNACNLLVYGDGKLIPETLNTIQPYLKYSIIVGLSASVQYGRAILIMDKGFCTDSAGNRFIRAANSSVTVHIDRRKVFADLRTHVPERLLQLDGDTRTVQATNNPKDLKVYFYFTEPVLNTSTGILNSIHISRGFLRPINGSSLKNRRFGYMIEGIPSFSVVTVSLNSDLIVSRQGTPISPVAPTTFLYDSERPAVRLSTTSKMRTRKGRIGVSIKFLKPVFGFNSTLMSISGGHVESFEEISKTLYVAMIQVFHSKLIVIVPENVATDIAGNLNLASNQLQIFHYSMPVISTVFCFFVTVSFVVTALVACLLNISTASLQAAGAFPKSSSSLTSNPTRNLFRIACYIQMFALSRWLPVILPIEYYEFTNGIKWSVPYFNLPWESDLSKPVVFSSNTSTSSHIFRTRVRNTSLAETELFNKGNSNKAGVVYGTPLTEMEYQSFFESQNYIPLADYISDRKSSIGWRSFWRSMFWLVVISGSMILLHVFLLLILHFRKRFERGKSYGSLILPRFEIFLTILAVPCICMASAAIIKGGTTSGAVVGALLLVFTCSLQLALFLFLSYGITLGKLLQYKEVHQVGKRYHWYQELIRVTLGPGKRGQWTWKNEPNSKYLTKYGPLFEDLRGPPKYMLSMIAGVGRMPIDRIIASDDETDDAEAPLIQKIFGILRIYYTLLESIRRFLLGLLAGLYLENPSLKAPTIILLCFTSFQLFFLVLKKPFIKKKVQLAEITSIACQVGVLTTFVVLLEREFSIQGEKSIGTFMLCLFMLGYLALMANEWFALHKQIRKLDTSENSFSSGLKTSLIGLLLLFLPETMAENLEKLLPEDKSTVSETVTTSRLGLNTSSGSRSSSTSDRTWIKQLREMARAGFREGNGTTGRDPSSSNARRSGFWRSKQSGSSSKNSSNDYKSRPRSLYKDLEAIFASK